MQCTTPGRNHKQLRYEAPGPGLGLTHYHDKHRSVTRGRGPPRGAAQLATGRYQIPRSRITLWELERVDFADSNVQLEPIDAEGSARLRFEGDDVECLQRLKRLLADIVARKHPDLLLPMPYQGSN